MPDVPSMKDRPLQPKRLSAVREREDETNTETPETWGFHKKREMFEDKRGSTEQTNRLFSWGHIFGRGLMNCLTWES